MEMQVTRSLKGMKRRKVRQELFREMTCLADTSHSDNKSSVRPLLGDCTACLDMRSGYTVAPVS